MVQGGAGESVELCRSFLTTQVPFFRKGRVSNLKRFFPTGHCADRHYFTQTLQVGEVKR